MILILSLKNGCIGLERERTKMIYMFMDYHKFTFYHGFEGGNWLIMDDKTSFCCFSSDHKTLAVIMVVVQV